MANLAEFGGVGNEGRETTVRGRKDVEGLKNEEIVVPKAAQWTRKKVIGKYPLSAAIREGKRDFL